MKAPIGGMIVYYQDLGRDALGSFAYGVETLLQEIFNVIIDYDNR